MIGIEYPNHSYRIKKEAGRQIIFDEIRKKWIHLTPEEWVRQNFIQYLLRVKNYPASLIAIEREIKLGDLKKRCDIVVYREHVPWMIVECKEQDTGLDDAVVQQILRYNISLDVRYLVITNGGTTFGVELNKDGMSVIQELPGW